MITGVNLNLLIYNYDEPSETYKVSTCLQHPIYVEYQSNYNDISSFKIVAENCPQNAPALVKYNLIQLEYGQFGEITTSKIDSSNNTITLTGNLCDGILKQRWLFSSLKFDDVPLSEVFSTIFETMNEIPLLEFSISIPKIEPEEEGEEPEDIKYTGTIDAGNVFDIVQDLCKDYDLGYRTDVQENLNDLEHRLKFTFSIYQGKDETKNIVMSEYFGTIRNFESVYDFKDEVNSVTVKGKDISITVEKTVLSDKDRREYLLDCSGLNPDDYDGEIAYRQALFQKGEEVLQEYEPRISYSGDFYENSSIQPYTNFDVGTLVTVNDEKAQLNDVQRVTGILKQYDTNGKYTKLYFGVIRKSVSAILSRTTNTIIKEEKTIKETHGVGRNVGGHNEIFNVDVGEPDSNTISLTSGDQNTARGKNNQMHGVAYQCEMSGLNNKMLGWNYYCIVGGEQNQLGADDDNAYHNSVTMYGDDNIFIGNIQYSFIDGRSNRGTGGHIFNSIISGEQNVVVTDGIDDSILIGFKNTVNDVRRSFVGGSQNYVEDAIDSVVVGLNNQVIQPQHAIVCGQGATGNIANMYIVAGSVFTVDRYGAVKAAGGYSSMGADYAEMFEWADGNPQNEDRRGMLVTFRGDKIVFANSDDKIKVISANPSVIGNNPMYWHGKYKTDVFGAVIHDEDGKPIISEEYDPKCEYKPRSERPEWAPVAYTGRLIIVDDGSCVPGEFVSARQGIGTRCCKNTGIQVLKRIDETHVEVSTK